MPSFSSPRAEGGSVAVAASWIDAALARATELRDADLGNIMLINAETGIEVADLETC